MSRHTLKWIAIITMFIDHMGAILFPNVIVFRLIGRLAFPIFAFLITEGFLHTGNMNKYLLRLGLFALISEIPFDFAFNGQIIEFQHQNVFFTLFLGLVAIAIYDKLKDKHKLIAGFNILLFVFIAEFMRTDYSMFGILMIFVFYYFKEDFKDVVYYITYINLLMVLGTWAANNYRSNPWLFIQAMGPFALFFINRYNGEGGKGPKYLFYAFYPLHLLLLRSLAMWFL
jgi:hypothetical protein